MRILFVLQLDFVPVGERHHFDAWVGTFFSELARLGHEAIRFDSRVHRLKEYDWVHVFSSVEPETWSVMKDANPRLMVTPSLDPVPRGQGRRAPSWIRLGRALAQRKWPPIDETSFRGCAKSYFAPSNEWRDWISTQWGGEAAKITVFSENPVLAARSAAGVYESN